MFPNPPLRAVLITILIFSELNHFRLTTAGFISMLVISLGPVCVGLCHLIVMVLGIGAVDISRPKTSPIPYLKSNAYTTKVIYHAINKNDLGIQTRAGNKYLQFS